MYYLANFLFRLEQHTTPVLILFFRPPMAKILRATAKAHHFLLVKSLLQTFLTPASLRGSLGPMKSTWKSRYSVVLNTVGIHKPDFRKPETFQNRTFSGPIFEWSTIRKPEFFVRFSNAMQKLDRLQTDLLSTQSTCSC